MSKRTKYSQEEVSLLTKYFKKTNNITKAAKKFCEKKGIEYTDSFRRTASRLLEEDEVTDNKVELEDSEDFKLAQKRKLDKKSKYFLITWQQNATPIHMEFWNNILAYKKFLDAELSVVLGRYRNPTSIWTNKNKKDEQWDRTTKEYWDANRHDIHKYLTILSDMKTIPTAVNPLSQTEDITGIKSTIIGHPKLHMKMIPVLEGYPKKMLLTTGAVSRENYTDSKSGKRGESKHKFGFVIVEVKDKEVFFIRQVEADKKGNFIDLCHHVTDGKVTVKKSADALVAGDLHVGEIDPDIKDVTYKLLKEYKVDKLICHDLADGESVNNHIVKDPVQQFKRYQNENHLVAKELDEIIEFIEETPKVHKIVVQANHNDRFDRWIINQDWKKDIANSLEYLKYTQAVLEGKADKGVLAYVLEDRVPNLVTCLDHDDSYVVGKYELAHHGHIGASGSRGSLQQFRRFNVPMIVGHAHTPARADDVIQVGTSTLLRVGYNKGASNWAHAHSIIYENGIAQLLIFVRGEFTTFQ